MPQIATRGSFVSDQAKHATELLHAKYSHTFDKLEKGKTYLFEIIYPINRIVVDYGLMDDLVLLTVIDNETGAESICDIGFPVVRRFDGINDLAQLKLLEEENKEGFVVVFQNGLRVKMKFAEYCRLHRIITGVSNIAVWEYLKDGKSFDELLKKVPDEFYNWLMQTKNELESNYNAIYDDAYKLFDKLYHSDKKTFALRVLAEANGHAPILFNLHSGKKVDPVIWKMIRPEFSKPFKTDVDA